MKITKNIIILNYLPKNRNAYQFKIINFYIIKILMLTFVTTNENKFNEVKKVINNIQNEKIDLLEIQGSPQEIARKKCEEAIKTVKGPIIIEDTCLCFSSLGDLPGPYIKHFLESVGPIGLYKMISCFTDKKAWALCTFAYYEGNGKEILLFQGKTDGKIVEPRGSIMFGWDSIFLPDGFDQTYSEMDDSVKNSISHRYRALKKLQDYLQI
jgi:inosine triphosphate pyrophosphatase